MDVATIIKNIFHNFESLEYLIRKEFFNRAKSEDKELFPFLDYYRMSDYSEERDFEESIKELEKIMKTHYKYSGKSDRIIKPKEEIEKVIAKWRKEHADDPRVKIDIAREKEIMQINN